VAQSFPTGRSASSFRSRPAARSTSSRRTVAQPLSEKWKQPVLVDNKPGGGTVLGAALVAKAPPDGYTILLTVTAHAVNATLMDKLPFDPVKDFAPITMAATGSPSSSSIRRCR
jgi:tripartite-type tricarboxylate transporter receptor subunit TctC